MKRFYKLIINILVIFTLITLVLYSKGYRLSAESASKIFVEKNFLNSSTLIDKVMIDNYGIFLYQQENVRACSVVEKKFYLWKENTYNVNEANFGNFTYDIEQYQGEDLDYMDDQCLSAYDIYYNTDLKDKMKIKNIVEAYDNPFINSPIVYQLINRVELGKYQNEDEFDENLTLKEYQTNIYKKNMVTVDENFGLSYGTAYLDNSIYLQVVLKDVNLMISISYTFDYANMDQVSVKEAYTFKDQLTQKLSDYFISQNDKAFFESLEDKEMYGIFNEFNRSVGLAVTNIQYNIWFQEGDYENSSEMIVVDTKEKYAEYSGLLLVESDLDFNQIMESNYSDLMDLYGFVDLLIESSDKQLIQIRRNDFVKLIEDIEVDEKAYLTVGIFAYYASDFETLLNTPDLLTEIKRVANEVYEPVDMIEDVRAMQEKLNFALADHFGINRNRMRVIITTFVQDFPG